MFDPFTQVILLDLENTYKEYPKMELLRRTQFPKALRPLKSFRQLWPFILEGYTVLTAGHAVA
jgi:hypothetical protein